MCIGCLWDDICPENEVCDDFTPITFDVGDYIAKNKEEFCGEWNEYIAEYSDGDLYN